MWPTYTSSCIKLTTKLKRRRRVLFNKDPHLFSNVYTGQPFSFLIGLRRINSSNNNSGFQWIDGSPVEYSQWYEEEPNNGETEVHQITENCVIMGWHNDKSRVLNWSETPCNFSSTFYICQRTTGNACKGERILKQLRFNYLVPRHCFFNEKYLQMALKIQFLIFLNSKSF